MTNKKPIEQILSDAQRLQLAGDLEGALTHFKVLADYEPSNINLLKVIVDLCARTNNPKQAILYQQQLLSYIKPTVQDYAVSGTLYLLANDYTQAKYYFEQVIDIDCEHSAAYNNLAHIALQEKEYKLACKYAQMATRNNRKNAKALNNLGLAYRELGRNKQALQAFQQSVIVDPQNAEYQLNLALAYLYDKQFENGFKTFENRWQLTDITPSAEIFAKPMWQGQSFKDQTLLIHAEQGFGDTIQFCRYAPLIKSMGGKTLLLCQPSLVSLMETLVGIDQVVAVNMPLPEFDLHIPMMSLPLVMGLDSDNVPGKCPYLAADPERVAKQKHIFTSTPNKKIGIVWSGNPAQARNELRSCPVSHFAELAKTKGIQLYSLQKGVSGINLEAMNIIDMSAEINDFADTAALITQMDLVITVCTSVAHLAGALAIPTLVLLQYVPCWRWQLADDTSPFYPSITLVRQQSPGGWTTVFDKVQHQMLSTEVTTKQ